MATTIEQQVAMDEALVPSTQRCPFFKAFLVTADVPEIYMQEFWATAYVHQGQSFDELPFEEEILDFLKFLGHSAQIRTLTDVNINKLFQPWRSFGAVINKCLTGKSFGFDSFRRKRSGFGSFITPPTAIASPRPTIAATPKLTATAKGKQPAKATKAKNLSALSEVAMTEAKQLKLALKRSRQPLHISQPGGSGIDEGTGSKPGVQNVPSDDSKEEISWNSSDDEDANAQEKDRDDDEGDEKDESGDDDEESENDEESDDEETRKEESFDHIPRTPKDSKDNGNDEKDLGFKDGEDEWLNEEEEADELYRDVDINQGRGLQLSQDIEDSHVTLTLVQPDGQQESSSVSSQFVTSMLNLTSDVGVEFIFATASSSVAPLPKPTPIMTPSIITTITTASHPPIPPTLIPSEVL
nr:hypothetical protein [Tanacetum cinerariifolium]